MFQGMQDARDHGWSIRSVFVADPDGPRRVELNTSHQLAK
jgi:hypothetical protein